MAADDVSFRFNLVTLTEDGGAYEDQKIIDHIPLLTDWRYHFPVPFLPAP